MIYFVDSETDLPTVASYVTAFCEGFFKQGWRKLSREQQDRFHDGILETLDTSLSLTCGSAPESSE